MTRARYLIGLLILVVILIAVRLALPPLGVPGPFFARLEAVGFVVVLTVVVVSVLVLLRLRNARLNLLWLVPVVLWLAACEPAIRGVLGGADPDPGGLPGPIWNWIEVPAMLAAFLAFLALYERRGGPSRLEAAAAVVAAVVTVGRPLLVVGGLDRLLGGLISLPGDFLTFLLRAENWFGAAKGLFVLPGWVGGIALAVVFALLLAGMLIAEYREETASP